MVRIADIGGPTAKNHEVLVAGLAFEDRGEHELKGDPDRWHLFRVAK